MSAPITTRQQRARDKAYTDFAGLIAELREGVKELRRVAKREKWQTLLVERRVQVVKATGAGIAANVRGDSGVYRVNVYERGGDLLRECTCTNGQTRPGRATCHHVRAVEAVWTPPVREA